MSEGEQVPARRLCFALDLRADEALIAEYERHHTPGAVWPEVIADLRAQGVIDLSIWRTGNRLMMIADVVSDFPRPSHPGPSESGVRAWDALMARLQMPLPHAPPGQWWMPMHCLFDLAEHGLLPTSKTCDRS